MNEYLETFLTKLERLVPPPEQAHHSFTISGGKLSLNVNFKGKFYQFTFDEKDFELPPRDLASAVFDVFQTIRRHEMSMTAKRQAVIFSFIPATEPTPAPLILRPNVEPGGTKCLICGRMKMEAGRDGYDICEVCGPRIYGVEYAGLDQDG